MQFYPRSEWPSPTGIAPDGVDGWETGTAAFAEWERHLARIVPELAVHDLVSQLAELEKGVRDAVHAARRTGVSWSGVGRAAGIMAHDAQTGGAVRRPRRRRWRPCFSSGERHHSGWGELDDVFPSGSELIDPQVCAAVADDLAEAEAADRAHADSGDGAALDAAMAAWARVLAAPVLSAAYPGLRAALLNDAAGSVLRRFWHRGLPADLDVARDRYASAIALTPPVSARRIGRLGNLAMVRREAHQRFADAAGLADAERLLREALRMVDMAGDGVPGAAATTSNLALVLRDRYLAERDAALLREAIPLAERGVGAADDPGTRVVLGDLLSQYFPHSNDDEHLQRAVALLTDALTRIPEGSPERPRAMVDVGIALAERHAVIGDPADLDTAVDLLQEALTLLPDTAPDTPSAHGQLAVALYRRFEVTGLLDDLDRAIALLESVVEAGLATEAGAPAWRMNLATALIQRHRRTDRESDLDRAIATYEDVLGATGGDRYAVTNNLGNALRDRARRPSDGGPDAERDRADLDRAAALLRDAVQLCALGSVRHASTLANLGQVLRDRYLLTRDAADLAEALTATEGAVEVVAGADDTDRARRWFGRASVLRQAEYARADGDSIAVDAAYRAGCSAGTIEDPESVLVAAQDWGRGAMARSDWPVAVEAFAFAIGAVGVLVTAQAARHHRETWLRAAPGLSAVAAHASTQAGDLPGAVVAMERTRAAMLAEVLGRDRTDLEGLAQERPDLARRFRRAAGVVAVGESGVPTRAAPVDR
ncbi:MAG: tetratricopeptide repeat protein [Pseudonocardia sp.]